MQELSFILDNMNHKDLLAWYENNHRELPFRKNREPYRIWISEIMAQQTRIEAMMPAYEKFIALFPDVRALAQGDDDVLMKAWQGLGYYSRARNLKKAAQVCVDCYDGQLPEQYGELKKLPGIGEYTAGAIASIAHGERIPAVDGNVIRVYARHYGLDDDFSNTKNKKQLTSLVRADLPDHEHMPFWNQALMELGALVCTPKIARCEECPLRITCQSAADEAWKTRPTPKKKSERRIEKKHVVVLASIDENQKIWLHVRRRPDSGLLASLYEFDDRKPQTFLKSQPLGDYRHVFSHVEWLMSGELVLCSSHEGFLPAEEIERDCSIPSAFLPFYQRAMEFLKKEQETEAVSAC